MLSLCCFHIYLFFYNPFVSTLILALSHYLSLEPSNKLTPDTHLSFISFVPQISISDMWIFRPHYITSVSTINGSYYLQNQLQIQPSQTQMSPDFHLQPPPFRPYPPCQHKPSIEARLIYAQLSAVPKWFSCPSLPLLPDPGKSVTLHRACAHTLGAKGASPTLSSITFNHSVII